MSGEKAVTHESPDRKEDDDAKQEYQEPGSSAAGRLLALPLCSRRSAATGDSLYGSSLRCHTPCAEWHPRRITVDKDLHSFRWERLLPA